MSRSWIASIALVVGLMISLAGPALAQTSGGQVCLRAFEDRNSNGVYDPGEPLITRGVSATLADAQNIVIQSGLLDDSPQAAQGILCFQRLTAGQYTITVASADFTPTTSDTYIAGVTETSIPQVFDFGARVIVVPPVEPAPTSGLSQAQLRILLERLFFAGLGAIVVIGGMTVIGTLLYALVLRPRARRVLATSTGAYRAVRATGEYRTATGEYYRTDTGEYRTTDTGQYRRTETGSWQPVPGSAPRPAPAQAPAPSPSTPASSMPPVAPAPYEAPTLHEEDDRFRPPHEGDGPA